MAASPGPHELEVQFLQHCYDKQEKAVKDADADGEKLAEIAATYKSLTGEDITTGGAATAAPAPAPSPSPSPPPPPVPPRCDESPGVVPVGADAPSSALFLDLYPTGSQGNGLPMCVSVRLSELVEKRDPTDSGVDLLTPAQVVIPAHTTVRIKLGMRATVRSAMTFYNYVRTRREALLNASRRVPYWLAPRSSISKTPLILANSMGIVDAGYNGELMAAMHNTSDEPYVVQQFDRLVQIVSGDLTPFCSIMIREPNDRPDKTTRGECGFGSTGK